MPPQAQVDLAAFSTGSYDRGAGMIREVFWLLLRTTLFEHFPVRWYRLKRWVLRRFGAVVGRGVVIKPGVKVTFPWKLRIGDNVWLGEDAWLLNLEPISIESNVCLSQRAMLCTGNHDYNSPTFALRNQPIHLECGSWIAASAWVGPGVRVGSHAVLTAGSVTAKDLEPYGVYRGNPAIKVRRRRIEATADVGHGSCPARPGGGLAGA